MALTRITGTVIKDGGIHHADLPDSGVTANSYGSGTAIPVLTVNSKGIVTSVTTTSVAGVSSLSWDTGTEILTLSTADGGSYTADLSGMASQGYVDTAISNLIASAPGTLDTLDELAAALGDDANFASTVTTSLSGKVDKINITGATVGDASNVPVITFNSQGQITSATTTAVAGVSSVTYNDQTGVLTINTSDGGSHTADINVGYDDDPTFETVTIKDIDGIRGIGRNNNAYNLNLLGGADQTDGAWIEINGGQRGGAGNAANGRMTFYTGSDHSASQNAVVGDYYFKTQWLGNSKTLMHIDSSTGYVGINATPSATLTVGGNIAVTGTVDGRDLTADGTKLDGIEVGATADQTKADIDALGINADQVDGLHASQFLRSDANDSFTATQLTLTNSNPSSNGLLSVLDDGASTAVSLGTTARIANNGGNGSYAVLEASSSETDLILHNNGHLKLQNATQAPVLELRANTNQLARIQLGDGGTPVILDSRPDMGDGFMIQENGAVNTVFRAGNVGIGTTSPEAKLHVAGQILAGSGAGTNLVLDDGAESAKWGLATGGYNLSFQKNNGSGTYETKVTISQNGYLGIGTESPTQALHVIDTALIYGNNPDGSEIRDWPTATLNLRRSDSHSAAGIRMISIGYKDDGLYQTGQSVANISLWNYDQSASEANKSVSDSNTELRIDSPGPVSLGAGGSTRFLTVLADGTTLLNGPAVKLPVRSSDPTSVGDGYAYFNTSDNQLKIYNSSTSKWGSVTFAPLGSQQNPATSAAAIKAEDPNVQSGLYYLLVEGVNGGNAFQTYCDFSIDGGIGYAMMYQEYFSRYETGPYQTEMNSADMFGTAGWQSEYRFAPANFVTNYNGGNGASRLIMFANTGGGTSTSGITSCNNQRWVRFSSPSNGTLKTWACDNFDGPTNSAAFQTWNGYSGTAWHSGGHGTSGGVNQITNGQITNDRLLWECKWFDGSDPNHYWMVDGGQTGDTYYRTNPEYGDSGVLGACWGGMLVY